MNFHKFEFVFVILLGIFFGLFYFAGVSFAATINAVSCSQADVQAAISTAVNGDTVVLPICPSGGNGSGYVSISKNITIQGAGASGTVINQYGWFISNGTDGVRITGVGSNYGGAPYNGSTYIKVGNGYSSAGPANFRIDHCTISNYDMPVWIGAKSKGVIDDNQFFGSMGNGILYYADALCNAAGDWSSPIDYGSSGWVFIENNYFNNQNGSTLQDIMGWMGAKYVIRYNTFEETVNSSAPNNPLGAIFDMHGELGSGAASGRAAEIYNNKIIIKSNKWTRLFNIRGGTGLIFNNRVDYSLAGSDSNIVSYVNLWNARARPASSNDANAAACPNLGAPNRFCATADGGEGYSCVQQIGQGVRGGTQEPMYIWNNTRSGDGNTWVAFPSPNVDADVQWAISQNRDYCLYSTSTSCNSITTTYTSYACPNPLTGYSGSCDSSVAGIAGYNIEAPDTTPPAAPTGVQVN